MATKKEIILNQNSPAFPCSDSHPNKGLTKLEYFTALALQGCLANSQYRKVDQVEIESYAIEKAKTAISLLYFKAERL